MTIEGLSDGILGLADDISNLAKKPLVTALGSASLGAVVGGAVVGLASKNKKSRSKRRRKSPKKKSKKSSKKRKRKARRTPHTAGKGKDRSTKRIRHTKTGQPYIILKSGKARFISKKSAKASRKRKGGRY